MLVRVRGCGCTVAREISTGVVSWLFRLIGFYSVTETSELRPVIRDHSWGNTIDAIPASSCRYDYWIAF